MKYTIEIETENLVKGDLDEIKKLIGEFLTENQINKFVVRVK